MLRKTVILLCAAALVFSLTACGQSDNTKIDNGYPLTVGDITLQKPPSKVAVLFQAAADVAVQLGAKSRLCSVPDGYKLNGAPEIGTTGEPNIEKILTLSPDAVITTEFTSDIALSKLIDANIPVIKYKSPSTMKELKLFYRDFGMVLGGNTGKQTGVEKYEALIAELESTVSKYDRTKAPTVAVAFADVNTQTRFASGSLVGELLKYCNVTLADHAQTVFCRSADVKNARAKFPSAEIIAFDYEPSGLCGQGLIDAATYICGKLYKTK